MIIEEQTTILDSSKIKDAMRCLRYFYFRHILGWRREGTNHNLVFGSAWHKAMEVLLQKGYSSNTIEESYEAFLFFYRERYSEATDLDYAPKDPGNAYKALQQYVAQYGTQDDFDNIMVETLFVVPIDVDKVLYAKLDSVNRDKRGIFSLEHKTSKYLAAWWHDQWLLSFQVGAYTHVLYSQFKETDVFGVIINGAIFRKGTGEKGNVFPRVEMRKTMDSLQDWLLDAQFWYNLVLDQIHRLETVREGDKFMKAFPRCRDGCVAFGRSCQYLDICHAWHNPQQVSHTPPFGFVVDHWDPRAQEVTQTVDLTKGGQDEQTTK